MNYTRYALSIALLFSGVTIANEHVNLNEETQEVSHNASDTNEQETTQNITLTFTLKNINDEVIDQAEPITVVNKSLIRVAFMQNMHNNETEVFELTTTPTIVDKNSIEQEITFAGLNDSNVIKRSVKTDNKETTIIALPDNLVLEVYTEIV